MNNFIAWWVKNPIAANLLMLIIFAMGVNGFFKLEREFVPTTDFNQITVSSVWQGASPKDMQEQIVFRIEEAIEGIDGIDFVEARAREGRASVDITTLVQADFDRIYEEVKTRVDGINNLPPDAFRLQVQRAPFEIDFIYMALYGDLSKIELQRLALEIRDEMAKLPSGNLTQMITKLDEEVTIEISEDDLRRFDLTFTQVANAIRANSLNSSAGDVETSAGRLQMRTRSLASTQAEFEDIIVRQTANGGTVRVKDIATVIDGFEDIDFRSEYKGNDAMFLRVLSPQKSNITEAGKAFRAYIEERNKTLPEGVVLEMWADASQSFDAQMSLIGSNAFMGLALVLVILGLFLRPKVALWVTIGIITSFMGALAIAPYIGISFNIISTFAFLLVIGIIVDDAIVVGESVHFHVEHGVSGEEGAIGGTRLVTKPVFFAVMTTMMAFTPWAFFSGPTSSFTTQITLVVVAALAFSLVEAFLILPSHLRHLKPIEKKEGKNKLAKFQENMAESLTRFAERRFRPAAAFFIKNRYATLATFIGLFILSIGAISAGFTKVQMAPEIDGDMMQVSINFPEGTSFERTLQVQEQMEDAIKRMNKDAKEKFNIDYELIPKPGSFIYATRLQAFLSLAPPEDRDTVTSEMIENMFQEYLGDVPDAYRVRVNAGGGGGNQRGVFFGVASSDPEALRRSIFAIKDQLDTYGSTVRTWDNFESSAQEMQFTLKPGAERLGIDLRSVSKQVREAFFGQEVQRVPRDGEDVRVVVRYPEAARESIDSLENLRIRGTGGVEVPLYQVAEVSFAPGVTQVRRRDSKQVAYVGARLRGGPEARQQVQKDMNENFLPNWELQHPKSERLLVGDDKNNATFASEAKLFTWLMFGSMYVLLAIAFKSYSQPILILVAIPFAFVGMTFGNVIVGTPLGIMSIFGFFAAAGVAVNDNLVLLDYVNRLRAKGVGAYQAIVDACVARFRPILLTSVTTFMGVLPMLAENSVQAQFMKPMVVALAFGVLFDFFLTLILVPAMYGIGVDIRRTWLWVWTGVKQPPLGSRYNPDVALALETMDADLVAGDSGKASPQPAE